MKIPHDISQNHLFSQKRLIGRQIRAIVRNREGAGFLVARVAEEFAHRLGAVNREFANGADLFSFSDKMSRVLKKLPNVSNITRFELPQVAQILGQNSNDDVLPLSNEPTPEIDMGIGWPRNLDLVVSAFGLHSANDLPQLMAKIFQSMREDGLIMVALPIRGTLDELRDCLMRAELELAGGAASRIDPFIDMQQAGRLLQSSGFRLPVIDREDIIVRYDNMKALIEDLRSMGMTSAKIDDDGRKAHRQLFQLADEIYQKKYSDGDGRIRASFCFAYLTAWSPHENQQKPIKPGSAKFSLAEHFSNSK